MNQFLISEKNQKELLKLARESIQNYVKTGKMLEFKTNDSELLVPSAVFVTLTRDHHLRGCIGTTVAQKPLYEAVLELAVAAAVEDSRFQRVKEGELKDLKIEISVLSPLQRIKSVDEIKPKIHGVVVRRGFRSGLFLPQVWEQLPNKEEFMNELCWEKAGLNPAAWKEKETELYIFTVFPFEEE